MAIEMSDTHMHARLSPQTLYALKRHNLLFGWWTGYISLEDVENYYRVSIGDESIHIINPNRWRRYRRGVTRQLLRLAYTYGALSCADSFYGKVVLDIGANIGEFSLFAYSKGAHVIAFEPDPLTLKVLHKNIGERKIRVIEKALWKETTRLPLYSAPLQSDSGIIPPPQYDKILEIDAVKLDDVTADLGLTSIYFIKGDAEGAEPEVLLGARTTLKKTQFIALDCGPERQGRTTVRDTTDILTELGFTVRRLKRRRTILFGTNHHTQID